MLYRLYICCLKCKRKKTNNTTMKYVFFYVQFNVQYACSTKTKIAFFFSGLLSLLLKRYYYAKAKKLPRTRKNGVVVHMYVQFGEIYTKKYICNQCTIEACYLNKNKVICYNLQRFLFFILVFM